MELTVVVKASAGIKALTNGVVVEVEIISL